MASAVRRLKITQAALFIKREGTVVMQSLSLQAAKRIIFKVLSRPKVLDTKPKYLILSMVEYLIQCTKDLRKYQMVRT